MYNQLRIFKVASRAVMLWWNKVHFFNEFFFSKISVQVTTDISDNGYILKGLSSPISDIL